MRFNVQYASPVLSTLVSGVFIFYYKRIFTFFSDIIVLFYLQIVFLERLQLMNLIWEQLELLWVKILLLSISILPAAYITNTTRYRWFFHSKKPLSSWTMPYVLWCKVTPCSDNTYKYSPSENAHILNLSFFLVAFFSWVNRFILEPFLSNFSISVVYPAVALKSRYILSSLVSLSYSDSCISS